MIQAVMYAKVFPCNYINLRLLVAKDMITEMGYLRCCLHLGWRSLDV
jgi:hypothetical protein